MTWKNCLVLENTNNTFTLGKRNTVKFLSFLNLNHRSPLIVV